MQLCKSNARNAGVPRPLNSDLSRLEAAAQPYNELGLVWDCSERVVDTDHHILLVVAIEMIDL